MTVSLTRTPRVPVPADVRDNSETVTDYAFSRHRAPDRGVTTTDYRDRTISYGDLFGYTLYSWHDVNQGNRDGWGAGQRCRIDMMVNRDGRVVHLFHTEYWTRVACGRGDWCHSYAAHYTVIETAAGDRSDSVGYCDEHIDQMRRHVADVPSLRLHLSERLLIGQHD